MSCCKEVRRIRLDLSEVLKEKPRVWFLINPKPYVETVKLLKERLAEKFQFKNGLKFSLYLDEFEIPDDESVLIFRDDDLVVIKHNAEATSCGSQFCAAVPAEVDACSSSSSSIVTSTASKTKKRKRKPEDDEEIDSEKARRRRIDRQEEEVIRDESCSPSPEQEAEEPSSEVEQTAVPKKKKHKSNKKKKKKRKEKEKEKEKEAADAEEIEEDESDNEREPQVVTPTQLTDEEVEDSPRTPTPKKKRRRRKKRKAYKTSDEVTEEDPEAESVPRPLNMGQWQPAGSHLRFEDEDDGQIPPIQLNGAQDELLTLPQVVKNQQVPVVIQRRKKTSPENPAIEKEHQVNKKEPAQGSCSVPTQPKPDYSNCAALQGPPRPGDVIAYKELELSAEYCPKVSDYKEGVVMHYDPDTKVVTVEFLPAIVRKVATGRFELRTPPPVDEYGEYAEEAEQEETETITEGSIELEFMIEPKLISVPCSQRSPAY